MPIDPNGSFQRRIVDGVRQHMSVSSDLFDGMMSSSLTTGANEKIERETVKSDAKNILFLCTHRNQSIYKQIA